MEKLSNYVQLCGILAGRPEFSHSGRNEEYYIFPLDTERLSGTVDTINVIARKSLLDELEVEEKQRISVVGELRSFNNKSGVGNKLVITVFAKEICFTDEEDNNYVMLTGALCKPANLRKTPMGREICDMMIAANRKYGRSDYLPCIAWGSVAQTASELIAGDIIQIEGRIQSRNYIKIEDGVSVSRTAFEVSVISITI